MRAKQIPVDNRSCRGYSDGFSMFLEEIKERNVLLIIGHAFEANKDAFNGSDFYGYLQHELNELAGTSGMDFSDLSYDNRFLLDRDNPNHIRNIHDEIVSLIEANDYSADEDVSQDLMKLIGTGYFRFVFTTSFDPLVELAMKKQFGVVRVMNIFDKSNRDIDSKWDFDTPTVYYLFGKAMSPNENEMAKKFVATDNDALGVLKKWQIDMGNSMLLRYTSEKFLLTLGCMQDDWLFRFIWYTLKGEPSKLSRGVVAGLNNSASLSHYLKMNHILIDNNPEELVEKIISSSMIKDDAVWDWPQLNCDVFISYSRKDSEYAEALYHSLTSCGLRVWYDKNNLGGRHGGRFMEIIRQSIDTSTLFIAIVSNTISLQAHEAHVYRREWEWAKEMKLDLTADCRCFVTFPNDYDIYARKYADALGWLAETDNYQFDAHDKNFDKWAKDIQSIIIRIRSNVQYK